MTHLSRWKITLLALSLLFGLLFAYPNLLSPAQREALPSWVPSSGVNLGLDLQGGSYLLLEVDTPAMSEKRLANLGEDTRSILQEAGVGVSAIAREGNGVTITLANPAQMDTALTSMRALLNTGTGAAPNRTVTRQGDNRIRYAYTDQAMAAMPAEAVTQSIEVVRRRLDSTGTKEISISRQGAERIVVQAPGQSDPAELERLVGQTAQLTFQMVNGDPQAMRDAVAGTVPPGYQLVLDTDGATPLLVERRIMVSGENLTRASVGTDQNGQTAIDFRFDGVGGRRFGSATAANIGQRFAILLDGKVISAPTIQSAISGGSGQITGNFTIGAASELVNLLNGGALPAPLKVEERRTVTAELGADAVRNGAISTAVGFVIIVVFMLGAYGLLFGGISVIGLVLNGLLIIASMSLVGATLTLPGIAGLVLTFAVAVDANVLIYERMRDEARQGRSVIASVDAGFNKAMGTIVDANLTTLAAALIMFVFGAGPVRGFAWTLTIGVFTSMLSAVLVSQVGIALWLKYARPKTLPIADNPPRGAGKTATAAAE